jgi:hypothetical protein
MAPDSISALAGTQLTLQGRARAKRLLDVLRTRLEEEERPLYLATASRGTLVATTDRRLIVIRGDDAEEIPYDRMISFAAGRDGRKPFIQIQADTVEILVKGLSDSFDDICRLVHSRMWDVSLERLAEPAHVEPLRRAAGGAA